MNKVREPFNTNHLAQVAALAALGDERHLRRVVRLNRKERERLGAALAGMGLEVVPSEANFLLVGLARDGGAVYQALLRRGRHRAPGRQLRLPAAPARDGGHPGGERPVPRRAGRGAAEVPA